MPRYIVKVNKDEDKYIVWSTVIDGPVLFADRAGLLEDPMSPEAAPERIARADRNGTSANWPWVEPENQLFGWNDEYFSSMEISLDYDHANYFYDLPRSRLTDLYDMFISGEITTIPVEWMRITPHPEDL